MTPPEMLKTVMISQRRRLDIMLVLLVWLRAVIAGGGYHRGHTAKSAAARAAHSSRLRPVYDGAGLPEPC